MTLRSFIAGTAGGAALLAGWDLLISICVSCVVDFGCKDLPLIDLTVARSLERPECHDHRVFSELRVSKHLAAVGERPCLALFGSAKIPLFHNMRVDRLKMRLWNAREAPSSTSKWLLGLAATVTASVQPGL